MTIRTFQDQKGREWALRLNAQQMREIEQQFQIELLGDPQRVLTEFNRLTINAATFCDVLFFLIADQAERQEIDSEEFGRSLDFEVLEKASVALLEALLDFFPPHHRETLRAAVRKNYAAIEKAAPRLLDAIDLDAAAEAQVKAAETEFNSQIAEMIKAGGS